MLSFSPSDKLFFIVFSAILVALIIDTSIVKIYRFSFEELPPQLDLTLFSALALVYIVGQHLIIGFVRSKIQLGSNSGFQPQINMILKPVAATQYALAAILVAVLFQVAYTSGYDLRLVGAILWISYLQAICLTGFLAFKFFSWLKIHRSYVVLLYALAVSTLAANAIFTLLYVNDTMMSYSSYIMPSRGVDNYLPYVNPQSIGTSGFQITSVVSYVSMWLATAVLLRNYSKKLGQIRYWIIVSLPLVYFIIQFQPYIVQLFFTYRLFEPVAFVIIYTIFFSTSKSIGGILFGIAIGSAGKIVRSTAVRDFMIISAYGMVLFFTANQAVVLSSAPNPPFGISTVSFIGLGAYLLLVGIYSSAVSIAQDVTLRRLVRRSVADQSFLLDKIGVAEMERQVQKRVLDMTNNLSSQMEEKSGIQSSLAERDLREYIEKALRDIAKEKNAEDKD